MLGANAQTLSKQEYSVTAPEAPVKHARLQQGECRYLAAAQESGGHGKLILKRVLRWPGGQRQSSDAETLFGHPVRSNRHGQFPSPILAGQLEHFHLWIA